MTILLTGGAGFIGSHVARTLLTRGDRVIIVDDFNDYYAPAVKRHNVAQLATVKPVTVHEGDIRDAAFLARVFEREKPDRVCHLAARAGVRPSLEPRSSTSRSMCRARCTCCSLPWRIT